MRILIITIGIIVLAVSLVGTVLPASFAAAQSGAQNQDTQGIVCDKVPSPACENAGDSTVENITTTVTNVLTFLIGGISVIMTIVAGFMYVVSGGNPDKTKKAKDTLLYAIVGIIVAIAAQGIVRFVLNIV